MALLFNSFNSLFIGRLMLLIYFLVKQIKTICADTGLDFWHGPERSAFNFIFIDYTDNIICIKNCSLNPCHFTARVRGFHHAAGFSLPVSSFSFFFSSSPLSTFLSVSSPIAGWPFISFCCFCSLCDMCSFNMSLSLSPSIYISSPSRLSLSLFSTLSSPSTPLYLSFWRHCSIRPKWDSFGFDVFGHPLSFYCGVGVLDWGRRQEQGY